MTDQSWFSQANPTPGMTPDEEQKCCGGQANRLGGVMKLLACQGLNIRTMFIGGLLSQDGNPHG